MSTFTKLSARDLDIVGRIGLHGSASIPALAKIAGRHTHTVRHLLKRLETENRVKRTWIVNVFALGLQRISMLIALTPQSGVDRQAVVAALAESEKVCFIGELSGEFDLEVALLVAHVDEVADLFDSITVQFGPVITAKQISHHLHVAYFPRKHFVKGKPELGALHLRPLAEPLRIDSVDEQILAYRVQLPNASNSDLASMVGLSRVALGRRISRLLDSNVLAGALFSVRHPDQQLKNYKVLVSVAGFNQKQRETLYNFCYSHPHCTNYHYALGSADFELGVEVCNYQELLEFKQSLAHLLDNRVSKLAVYERFAILKYQSLSFGRLSSISHGLEKVRTHSAPS